MPRSICILFILLFSLNHLSYAQISLGPNSLEYPKIPKGEISSFSWESKIYPNTVRDYTIYVPAQYEKESPAALMIFQDGHTYLKNDGDFRATTVLDNLIAQEKMPVTIAVFINPGHHKDSLVLSNPWKASNRSLEYDSVEDTYGRFLIDEIIPEVSKKYNISQNATETAMVGISSGGICAFNAAWFFPERFQKVLSHIGSFTNIRGGNQYPSMIRKNPAKDIKVYLQGNENDLNNKYGDWWLSNQQMASALQYKNYDFEFSFSDGQHNGQFGGSILPQALEWLWKDRITTHIPGQVYTVPTVAGHHKIVSGSTMHFENMQLSYLKWDEIKNKSQDLMNRNSEQIVIIQRGKFSITVHDSVQIIEPNSIAVIMAGEKASIRPLEEGAAYYTMIYKSQKENKVVPEHTSSFIIHFNKVPFKEHGKGGVRSYFNTSTPMCPYYEMHITTLIPGIKSHPPHTHKAAEILLMIEGQTEEEIGNAKYSASAGDFFYLPAHVPHAIRNTGTEAAMYVAFQWY